LQYNKARDEYKPNDSTSFALMGALRFSQSHGGYASRHAAVGMHNYYYFFSLRFDQRKHHLLTNCRGIGSNVGFQGFNWIERWV